MIVSKPAILIIIVLMAAAGAGAYFISRRKPEEETVSQDSQGYMAVEPGSGMQEVSADALTQLKQGLGVVSTAGTLLKSTGLLGGATELAGGGGTAALGTTSTLAPAAPAAGLAPGAAPEAIAETVSVATPGASGLVGAGVGLAALAIVLAVANAWGVFEPWDPHAGFQKLTLSRDLPALSLKAGDIVDWVPDAVYDKVMAGDIGALDAFFDAQVQKNEAMNAAKQYVQRAQEEQQRTQDAAALAAAQAEQARQAQALAEQQAAVARDAQARSDAENALRLAEQQAAAAEQAAQEAAVRAAAAAQANSQPVKQAIAKKATGDAGRQYNYEGMPAVMRHYDIPVLVQHENKTPFYNSRPRRTRRNRLPQFQEV